MGIEWFRDLTIIIMGSVTTVVLIFGAILAYRLYRKLNATLSLIKEASQMAYDAVKLMQETIKPLLPIMNLIQGISGAFKSISKMFTQE